MSVDISVSGLHKYYGVNHVLKGITFEVYGGEKIGLLGKNGSGKTTLFKVIAQEEPYESGSVSGAAGKRIEILAQIPVFGADDTVEGILRSSFRELDAVRDAMRALEGDASPSALMRYGKLMEEYERLGGYDTDVKLEKICNGMNIGPGLRKSLFRQLSGGEQTRVNLARILLRDCDILLLDEPTNHLDLTSLEWLEKFLREFPGTVVAISHDRVFLDRVVRRIVEIRDGKAEFYEGNYSYYAEERERRFLTQAEQYKQQQKKIRQLETAAKRLHQWAKQADSGALHRRAFAIEKRVEQMDKVERLTTAKKLTQEFSSGGYAAKELVSFKAVQKRYGTKILLDNVSLTVRRDDSIALIGDNGCGKSTLLKLILGEEACDSGTVQVSSNVGIAYMPQIVQFDDENATVLETLRYAADMPEERARSTLAGFRFNIEDVQKKVGTLSGGEKSRLKLCLLMQSKVNFLILDEPTNHLDIESREWIEDAVCDFDGTMLFISHDRYFLRKFASKVWSMRDGAITELYGGFDDYLNKTQAITNQLSASSFVQKKKSTRAKEKERRPKPVSAEVLIREAEHELKAIDAAIEESRLKSDFKQVNALYEEKHRLEEKIDCLYDDWVEEN